MSAQLELHFEAAPYPYEFAPPLAVRQIPAGLSFPELLPLVSKDELWSYEPRTGLLTIHHPLPKETEE